MLIVSPGVACTAAHKRSANSLTSSAVRRRLVGRRLGVPVFRTVEARSAAFENARVTAAETAMRLASTWTLTGISPVPLTRTDALGELISDL